MSEQETVGPALAPEEWSGDETVVLSADSEKLGYFGTVELAGDALRIHVVGPRDLLVEGGQRHALAALALHGQPYGPKREWVKALLENDALGPGEDPQYAGMIRAAAAFIAALLPPESP